MFCFHKWSEPIEGKQRCTKCNKIKCVHEFEIIRQIKIVDSYYSDIQVGFKYHLQCKHCGIIKKKRV